MLIADILRSKSAEVVRVSVDASIADATGLLHRH